MREIEIKNAVYDLNLNIRRRKNKIIVFKKRIDNNKNEFIRTEVSIFNSIPIEIKKANSKISLIPHILSESLSAYL